MSATTADPIPANNSASATTTVNPAADLSLTKTDSPDPVLAGQLLTYTLTASQRRARTSATGVTVTDTLPAGVDLRLGHALPGHLLASRAARSRARSARSRTAATRDRRDQGHAAATGARSRTRRASPPTTADPNSANNSASATTTVDPAADLSLTKTDSPDPVLAGQLLTYTLTVAQRRPVERHAASTLTDTLPAGVTFDSATPSQGSCSQSSGTVTCALGTLADGRARPSRSRSRRSRAGTITNQANVSATSSTRTRRTTPRAPTRPSTRPPTCRSPSPTRPTRCSPAQLLTYTLGVSNAGPSSATGVDASPTRCPAGVTFDSATPSQGTCSESSGTVTCALGTIANGAERDRRDQGPPAGRRARSPTRQRCPPTTADPVLVNNSAQRRRPPSTRPPTCR